MKTYLLPKCGNFYKTNLHCHTNISDGQMSPEEVKERYKALGYSAVCYTDHEVLIGHKELCDDSFIALHGYEVAIKKDLNDHTGYFMPVYHFNLIAENQNSLKMPRFFKNNPSMSGNSGAWADKYAIYDENDTIETTEYSIEWLNDYLTAARDAGFLITYNHPQWSLHTGADYLGLKGLHAIETMNSGCFIHGDCTSIHFDAMLQNGMDVLPVGGDDNHNERGVGESWTMIKAPKLTYNALIKAYKNGDCYASTGPEIKELYVEDGKLYVKASHSDLIFLRGEGRYIAEAFDCSEAVFPLKANQLGKHFRIEIRNKDGKLALTRAYKTENLNL